MKSAPQAHRFMGRRILAAFLGLVALAYYSIAIPQLSASRSFDFAIYYISSAAAGAGLNPYNPKDFAATQARFPETPRLEVDRATEPPPFLLFIRPLTYLSYGTAFPIWTAINLLALVAGLIYLFRLFATRLDRDTLIALASLAALYHPITSNLSFGQSKLVLFFLLCLMLDAISRDNDLVAGSSLAAASLLRAFPVLLMGYLLMRRRTRLLKVTTVAIAVGGLATLLIAGPASAFEFLAALPYLTTNWVIENLGNVALNAVIMRWLFDLASHHSVNRSIFAEDSDLCARLHRSDCNGKGDRIDRFDRSRSRSRSGSTGAMDCNCSDDPPGRVGV